MITRVTCSRHSLRFGILQQTATVVLSSHRPQLSVWSTKSMSYGDRLHDESLTLRFVLWCQC